MSTERTESRLGRRALLKRVGGLALGAPLCWATAAARADNSGHLIQGESAVLSGGIARTWARVNGNGAVIWVGLTVPLSMVETMPPPGTGPARAAAVLNYPAVVQQTTYFNHAEIHSNPHGHVAHPAYADPHRYEAPHFDFHLYAIPVAQVWAIPGGQFSANVSADLLPAGYAQPAALSVPQMGRHASPLSEFTATDPWLQTVLSGFLPDASYMSFIEPMITREFLLRRENFTLPVPTPERLGRPTRYPSGCVVHYDRVADAYHCIFKGFEWME
jgi:hypothetical protein